MYKDKDYGFESYFNDLIQQVQFSEEYSSELSYKYVYSPDEHIYKIDIDLPGYDKTEINIELDKCIRIEAKNDSRGVTQRGFRIYDNMDIESATSTFKNGVLEINIPELKKEKRTIKID